MSERNLYTFGYLSGRSDRIMRELIACHTPIVDIRYQPVSKRYDYHQDRLRRVAGIIYFHVPDLGNELYQEALSGKFDEPHIKLHDVDQGLAQLAALLDEHKRAALMCACTSKTKCHRILVARLAHERLPGLRIIHL